MRRLPFTTRIRLVYSQLTARVLNSLNRSLHRSNKQESRRMLSIFLPARRTPNSSEIELAARRSSLEERAARSDDNERKLLSARQDATAHKLRADVNEAKARAFDCIRPCPAQTARPFDGGEDLTASHLVDPDQENPLQQLIDDCRDAGLNVAGAEMILHAHQHHMEMYLGLMQRNEEDAVTGQRHGYKVKKD